MADTDTGGALARTIRSLVRVTRRAVGTVRTPRAHLIGNSLSDEQLENIKERLSFYAPALLPSLKIVDNIPVKDFLSNDYLLIFDDKEQHDKISQVRSNTYNIDWEHNPVDGWIWAQLSKDVSPIETDIASARIRFNTRFDEITSKELNKSYIFGTGPSLEYAIEEDFSDGYRIVCNTIVRDQALWQHIDPHFIVAGDAIYHFGHTGFARQFRSDLADRLAESDTMFLYPAQFDAIVQRELAEKFEDRLLPIDMGRHKELHRSIRARYELPWVGNALNLLLLPLGCSFSRNVFLWGFDGRAPDDQLFWKNSNKHSYPELMQELQLAHPAFFETKVPKGNESRYVESVHGDKLDQSLATAEAEGWNFTMTHPSWTPTLHKRYRGSETPEAYRLRRSEKR